jgi:hypothetical protein
LVQLRYNIMKCCPLTADAGQIELRLGLANHTAGRSAQNGGSRTATPDISAGWVVQLLPAIRVVVLASD